MSTTRNRSLVTGAPVLFVNFRRIESVPFVYGLDAGAPPFGAEGVKVSLKELTFLTRLGAALGDARVSIRLALIVVLRWVGLERFSGPGAPRTDCRVE